jgi:hypothetical protein
MLLFMNASARRPFLPFALISLLISAASFLAAAEKPEEEKGIWIDRADGRKLNLLIEENNFELHFYDEEKERMDPDALRAIIHYTPANVVSRETVLLAPAVTEDKGKFLKSPRFIRPPFQFRLSLVLVMDEAGQRLETPPVELFRQEEVAPPATRAPNAAGR